MSASHPEPPEEELLQIDLQDPGSAGVCRSMFFLTLRELRIILGAEHRLLSRGLAYDEARYVLKKQMLFDRLLELEQSVNSRTFDADEKLQVIMTQELIALCRDTLRTSSPRKALHNIAR